MTPGSFQKPSDHLHRLTVALGGNPNAGKTTVFNAITGTRQKVGNYPGVTVEKKEGFVRRDDAELDILDLPGTYSLTAYSAEEVVARNVLMDDEPDVVIDVIDSANLERNLYLAVQLLELGVPLVLAFNMADIAKSRGFEIDIDALSALLGVPIVETVGSKGEGIDELITQAIATGRAGQDAIDAQRQCNYGTELEPHIEELAELARRDGLGDRHARWFALKLLEHDKLSLERIKHRCPTHAAELVDRADQLRHHIQTIFGEEAEIVLADRRYGHISGACTETVRNTSESRHDISDQIDTLIANPKLGLPIFLVMMFGVFHLTFALGNPLGGLIEAGIGWLSSFVGGLWPEAAMPLLRSLILDGIIEGVGAVIVFLPIIVLLFLAISFLEDTGYLARAAFIVDRYMHKLGLHGKSFIPMLIGFGCSVPAIMATRTLESRRDRLTTMLIVPLMSCGARVPIYAMFVPAFFPHRWQAPITFAIYLLGILVAIGCAKLLRSTLLRGEPTPFVMELPPYRMPTLRGVLIHMWERAWQYVKKAGTVILLGTIILWAVNTFPRDMEAQDAHDQAVAEIDTQLEAPDLSPDVEVQLIAERDQLGFDLAANQVNHSLMGRVGHGMEPVLRPMGFDWKVGTAMLGALPAKEIFISQLSVINALGEDAEGPQGQALQDKLAIQYSRLQGVCIIIFALISAPCIATTAATWAEAGWKWAMFQFFGLTLLAYTITTVVYQAGILIMKIVT
jgi:ferrous iron transport protein B